MIDLIGRQELLDELAEALTQSADRHAASVLIGERGVGKTACLEAVAGIARRRGHRVLDTAGCAAESDLPFAGLHRLLRPLLPALPTIANAPRQVLMSALGMHDGPPPDPMVVALATLQLLTVAAPLQTTVITADDVHLLDVASFDVLTFLARRAHDAALTVIAAASWVRTPIDVARSFHEVDVDRLNDDEARELLARSAPLLSETQVAWILDRAAGTPLALIEMSSTAAPQQPAAEHPYGSPVPLGPVLQAAFAVGLDQLPTASQDVVLIAAIAFSDSLPEVLAAAALMSRRQVAADVLDPAVTSGILSYDETRVTFRHPLVRSAIVQQAPLSRRQAVHRALGTVITVNFARRTWHRADGALGTDDAIATSLEAHGSENVQRGAIDTAALAFRRAADLSSSSTERGRRLLLAAKQHADAGRLDEATSMRASAVLEDLSDIDRTRADILRDQCGEVALGDGHWVAHICQSATRALIAGDHGVAMDAASAAVRHLAWSSLGPQSVRSVRDLARRMATESGDLRATAIWAIADPSDRGRSFVESVAEVDADTILDSETLYDIAIAAWVCGDLTRCLDFLDAADMQLRERNMRSPLASVLGLSADIRLDLGHWAAADVALSHALSLPGTSMTAHQRANLLVTSAKLAALRGDVARMAELIEGAQRLAPFGSGSRLLARARIVEGIGCMSSARYAEAASILGRVFDPLDPSHHPVTCSGALGFLADATVRSLRRDLARVAVDEASSLYDISPSPLLHAQVQYSEAILADDDEAERLFLDGLASDLVRDPWPRARLQLAYGRWLRRHRQGNRSRAPLQAAQATFEQLGATRWIHETVDELRATHRRTGVDRAGEPLLAKLSSQELTIARMAASGLSNADIARELCLSPRTIGSHLYRIFPKLDVTSRSELSHRLQANVQ